MGPSNTKAPCLSTPAMTAATAERRGPRERTNGGREDRRRAEHEEDRVGDDPHPLSVRVLSQRVSASGHGA